MVVVNIAFLHLQASAEYVINVSQETLSVHVARLDVSEVPQERLDMHSNLVRLRRVCVGVAYSK